MHDRLPGYISFERYERNQAQLKANKAAGVGTVRAGSALLSGVLICGRCGLRMCRNTTTTATPPATLLANAELLRRGVLSIADGSAARRAGLGPRFAGAPAGGDEASLAFADNLEAERAALIAIGDSGWSAQPQVSARAGNMPP